MAKRTTRASATVTIDRLNFLEELTHARRIAERKATIPVLAHVRLTASNGQLGVAVTDLDTTLQVPLSATVEGGGSLCVLVSQLHGIVKTLAPGDVRLTFQQEGHRLYIESGEARFRLVAMDAEAFPSLPVVGVEEGGVEIDSELLRRMIRSVAFAICADEGRFQLNAASLTITKAGAALAATDGHRVAVVEVPAGAALVVSAQDSTTLIPKKALVELVKISEGVATVEFRRDIRYLAFRCGRREVTARVLEGEFPDWRNVVKPLPVRVSVERRHLSEAIARVEQMTGQEARGVRLRIGGGAIEIEAVNPDRGQAGERVACKIAGSNGEPLQIAFNPTHLQDALGAADSAVVAVEMRDAEGPGILRPVDGDAGLRHVCVVMPMHVDYPRLEW
jgi:DNA polymerase III subunit beta